MTTTKKRPHANNRARTVAPERAQQLLDELTVAWVAVRSVKRRVMVGDALAILVIDKVLADHVEAAMGRKKRRGP